MPHYAHTLIEHAGVKYQPGQIVPDDLSGLTDLADAGAVSTEQFTRQVTVDAQGRVIGDAHVECFAGDFTTDEIADPDVDTPSLGRPGDAEQFQHAQQHDAGEATA